MIEPRASLVPVTVMLPWDVARLIVQHGPALIQALELALLSHDAAALVDNQAQEVTSRACEQQQQEWAALASDVLTEIRRRSNRRGQRKALVKQIAAERGMSPIDLDRILRVYGKNGNIRTDKPVAAIERR